MAQLTARFPVVTFPLWRNRELLGKRAVLRRAAELWHVKGVNAVTLDDVRASGTSTSQLYHHFADKDGWVRAVIGFRTEAILMRDHQYLERTNSFRALQRWTDTIINLNALQNSAYGCPLGTIASARAGTDSGHGPYWKPLLPSGKR